MDPDPEKEIEVDPERGLKWIRYRQNVLDPVGSGSGSETLHVIVNCLGMYTSRRRLLKMTHGKAQA